MSSLEYLQRYKDGLDTLMSNGDMLSPPNYNSVNEFKSSVPALINHMSAVLKIASIPAMYITNNEVSLLLFFRPYPFRMVFPMSCDLWWLFSALYYVKYFPRV